MTHGSYKQFCPVAMAAEILCTRWTVVLLRELMAGSTRFNDLRRGVPRMSPALLSQRLKELEGHGVIKRTPTIRDPGVFEYTLTQSGKDLEPLIFGFGIWGQRWVETSPSLDNLDVHLLMWDMRRGLDPKPMPRKKSVIMVKYPELNTKDRTWWLVVEPSGEVDLCSVDPGFDVDLYLTTDLRTMTGIWMGVDNLRIAQAQNRLMLTGDRELIDKITQWIGLSPFAKERKLAG
jgi:DNA-binding HxlR family transcriptional regulator